MTWETRGSVEVLLAGATTPEPLPVKDLVEADLWDQLPADLPDLFARLPQADLYLQDEIQFAFHPTLTRVWSRKGRRGQRLVEAPGDNRKVYGFGLVDWRDGWFDGRVAPGRTADMFCEQVRAAVARSKRRGRIAIVMTDNRKRPHSRWFPVGAQHARPSLKEHVSLVYTPAYDPDANRHSRGSGGSRDGLSRIIISAVSSSSCSRMCRPIFRHSPRLPKTCFVISAVRLRQTRTKMLLSHTLTPHDQLGSI